MLRRALPLVVILAAAACGTPPREPTPPAAAPAATLPAEGSGTFQQHTYTFLSKGDSAMFFFDPALPNRDDVALPAMEHILRTDFRVDGRISQRTVEHIRRFTSGSGIYDMTPVRERDGGPITAVLVQPR